VQVYASAAFRTTQDATSPQNLVAHTPVVGQRDVNQKISLTTILIVFQTSDNLIVVARGDLLAGLKD